MNGGIYVKIQKSKKYITAFYMLGFFIGILYANIVSKQYLTSSGIFSEYFLGQYSSIDVIAEEYIVYILKVRIVPIILIIILGQTRLRKLSVMMLLLWTGFSSGMLIVASIVQLGMQGILLCMIGITPQFVFYILAYSVIVWYFYTYPISKWNYGKTIFVVLTLVLGIVTEAYINPILMKMFINAM